MSTYELVSGLWAAFYVPLLLLWVGGVFAVAFEKTLGRELRSPAGRALARFKREIHPFIPFLYLLDLAISTYDKSFGLTLMDYALCAFGVAAWITDKDDDDRWKRRRRRLAERVSIAAGRLVIVGARS